MHFLSTSLVKPNVQREVIEEAVPRHIQWIKEQIASGTIVQAGKWGKKIDEIANENKRQRYLNQTRAVRGN